MDVRDVALDDGELAGVQPDECAPLTSINHRVAPAAIRMGVHPALAIGTLQDALQLRRVEGAGRLFLRLMVGAAFGDDQTEGINLGQKAAAAVAITDPFAVDQGRLQPLIPANGARNAGRFAKRADAVAGFLWKVIAVTVGAMEVVAVADRRHCRAASGAVHDGFPGGSGCLYLKIRSGLTAGQSTTTGA